MALTSSANALQSCIDIARDVVLDKIERGEDFAFLSRAGERLYAQGNGPGSFVLHQLCMPQGKQPLRAIEAALLREQVLQALAFFPVPEGPLHERLKPSDVDWCHDLYVAENPERRVIDNLFFDHVSCPARASVVVHSRHVGIPFHPLRLILPESVPDEARLNLRIGVTVVESDAPAYNFRASTLGAARLYRTLNGGQRSAIDIFNPTDHAFSFSAILVGLRV